MASTGANQSTPTTQKTEATTTTEPPTTTEVQSAEAFKALCAEIEYREFEKKSESLKGNRYKFSGQVVEIQEENGTTVLRLAVDEDYLDDIVLVVYKGAMDGIYRDDQVTVCGTAAGDVTYESQAGWSITVPS